MPEPLLSARPQRRAPLLSRPTQPTPPAPGREVPAGSPEAELPLHGPNVWPPEALVPGFHAATEAYFSELSALGFRLLWLLAESLGLPPDYFDSKFDRPMVFLRPLRYSAEVSRPGDGVFGAGAHTDYVSGGGARQGGARARRRVQAEVQCLRVAALHTRTRMYTRTRILSGYDVFFYP